MKCKVEDCKGTTSDVYFIKKTRKLHLAEVGKINGLVDVSNIFNGNGNTFSFDGTVPFTKIEIESIKGVIDSEIVTEMVATCKKCNEEYKEEVVF